MDPTTPQPDTRANNAVHYFYLAVNVSKGSFNYKKYIQIYGNSVLRTSTRKDNCNIKQIYSFVKGLLQKTK